MTTTCFKPINGIRARFTRLNECGAIVPGPCSTVVTKEFTTFTFSPEIEESEEISVKTADGSLCLYVPSKPSLKFVGTSFTLCNVDPSILEITTGSRAVTDSDDNVTGFRGTTNGPTQANFALEVWAGVAGVACGAGSGVPYWYMLYPWLTGGNLAELEVTNGAITFTVENAKSQPNPSWGTGPASYHVDWDTTLTPPAAVPLSNVMASDEHYDMHRSVAPLPGAACGCTALTL